jgi:hypothetical protein
MKGNKMRKRKKIDEQLKRATEIGEETQSKQNICKLRKEVKGNILSKKKINDGIKNGNE